MVLLLISRYQIQLVLWLICVCTSSRECRVAEKNPFDKPDNLLFKHDLIIMIWAAQWLNNELGRHVSKNFVGGENDFFIVLSYLLIIFDNFRIIGKLSIQKGLFCDSNYDNYSYDKKGWWINWRWSHYSVNCAQLMRFRKAKTSCKDYFWSAQDILGF